MLHYHSDLLKAYLTLIIHNILSAKLPALRSHANSIGFDSYYSVLKIISQIPNLSLSLAGI